MIRFQSYRLIMKLTYPTIISMASYTLMSITDTAMVGRISPQAIGAVGIAGILIYTVLTFLGAVSPGVNALVAQSYGARDKERCARITDQGILTGILAGLLVMAIGHFLAGPIYRLMGPSDQVALLGVDYLRIRFYAGIGLILPLVYAGFFRGIGQMTTPMVITISSNGLNVLLNYFLIYGKGGFPRMETDGAALASAISAMVETAWFILAYRAKRQHLRFHTRRLPRWMAGEMRRLLKITVPIGTQELVLSTSFVLFTALVARMGDLQLAANEIVLQIVALSYLPGYGFAIAATTLVGQYMGAKQTDQAERSCLDTVSLACLFMGSLGVLFIVFSRYLGLLFTDDPRVLRYTYSLFVICGLFQVGDAVQIVFTGGLRGAADTRYLLFVTLVISAAVFLPLAYLLGHTMGYGVTGAWTALALDIYLLAWAYRRRFLGGQWKSVRI